ncbi:MAG: DUF2383 domain-containing protein [Pseudomonadota bacterium]
MSARANNALHDVHTATNDVLKGYHEMLSRAQPEIQPDLRRLIDLHEGHAGAQKAELVRLRDAETDDSSLQGTVNKMVVILRDWLSNLDRDVLPAVREGEESLCAEYDKALRQSEVAAHPSIGALLRTQRDAISAEIARLPKD